jgi:RNA polymerase sigma-70 factor (ECF subfamily)
VEARALYEVYGEFVGNALRSFGVPAVDLGDMLQEVFMVVHQRLNTFSGQSQVTTWLFGVCFRVAANYHRRAHRRREIVMPEPPEQPIADEAGPAAVAERAEARALLRAALDAMALDQRAVFRMFAVEERSCAEIAATLGIPVGTVYSRLHHARRQFDAALAGAARAGGPR